MSRNQGSPAPAPTKTASNVVEEPVDGPRLADDVVEAQLDAEAAHVVDLAPDDGLGQAELGDAVGEHAAGLVQGLEDGHLVAEQGQVGGHRDAGRPGADDGDAPAVERAGAAEPLDRALLAPPSRPRSAPGGRWPPARPSCPARSRFSHCSSCGQTRPQTAGRALVSLIVRDAGREVAVGDASDEGGDVDADRAAVDAAGLLAGEAARGLLAGQLGGVAEGDLVEVAHALERLLLRHRPPHASRPCSRALTSLLRSGRRSRCGAGARPPRRCSVSRRARNSSQSTSWPSKSGPSTQANFVLPPTVSRQTPHMPVPSIMIGFMLTIVLMPSGWVCRQTSIIWKVQPLAMMRSGCDRLAASRISARRVTCPL